MPTSQDNRLRPGDQVIEIKTGRKLTIERDYGPKFHPPYTVKENATLYFREDLELVGRREK